MFRRDEAALADDDAGLSAKDQYAEVCEVGRGGFGRALLVCRNSDGALFIIKEVDLHALENRQSGDNLADLAKQEASIMVTLGHPNIVRVYGSFIESNIFRLVMEYCDSGDLQAAIREQKKEHFAERQIREWSAQLTLTLKYLHDRHILHRDIKPSNAFLTANKRLIKLGDFGIAKVIEKTGMGGMTRVGTATFCAPEFCEGEAYTAQSEAWALGILIYNLAALELPFDGNNIFSLAFAIKRKIPKPLPGHYSSELQDFVTKLLEKDDKSRLSIGEALAHPFLLSTITELSVKAIAGNYSSPQNTNGSKAMSHASSPTEERADTNANESSDYSRKSSLQVSTPIPKQRFMTPKLDSATTLAAAEKGDLELIRQIASSATGRDFLGSLRATDETGDNLVHRATRNGQTGIVEFLLLDDQLKRLFELDAKNKKDDAAIHLAAARGHAVIVTTLAKAGADLNLLGAGGDNFAVLPDVIGDKLAKYVQKDFDKGLREAALHTASSHGHESVVGALVQLGANLKLANTLKNMPIHLASRCGHESIVEMYLNKGINTESQGFDNRTPLHYAAANDRARIARLLIRRGAMINAREENGWTPLHLACNFACIGVTKVLLGSGADVNAKDDKGTTPLCVACFSIPESITTTADRVHVARLLLQYGASLDERQNENGDTPLHLAALWGHLDMVKLLLDSGADIDAKNGKGNTPLGYAASHKEFDVIEFLISKGANVDAAKRPLYTVTGKAGTRPAWHLVLVDIPKLRKFAEVTASGKNTTDVAQYGTIVKSGLGENPPESVLERMKELYPF